ncbi:MAG: GNAT family N-acetyltransferase [Methylotetracoccus sp.]
MARHYLERMFAPESIALFGVDRGRNPMARHLLRNLERGGFRGRVYGIPRAARADCGLQCADWPDETAPPSIDLAILVAPDVSVVDALSTCARHHIPHALLISDDFDRREHSATSADRSAIRDARRHGIRLLGPDSFGLLRAASSLNASLCAQSMRAGSIALVSQSGAVCAAILDWAAARGIGFSVVATIGTEADISLGEILDYLALDAETRSILVYAEGFRDARRLMSGLRAAARLKPVVVVKAGRSELGALAARAHSGATPLPDEIATAALRRAGAVRADSIEQMFAAIEALGARQRPRGNQLAIVTNAGGPGVMATDRAAEIGIALATLRVSRGDSRSPREAASYSNANPLDLLGTATPAHFAAAVQRCIEDDGVDGVLAMLSPLVTSHPAATAERVIAVAAQTAKPVLACWLGGIGVKRARQRFAAERVPAFTSPDAAIAAFAYMAEHQRNQFQLLQTPAPLSADRHPDVAAARKTIVAARATGRSRLSLGETREVLGAFHIPMVPCMVVASASEAVSAADRLGFPVVLRVESTQMLRRDPDTGSRHALRNADDVRQAFDDLIGLARLAMPGEDPLRVVVEADLTGVRVHHSFISVTVDPSFGPIIAFGARNSTPDALADRAVALPPLNEQLARCLIAETRIAQAIGRPSAAGSAGIAGIVGVLLRVSELVCEIPELGALLIDPLTVSTSGVHVAAARIDIGPPPVEARRYAHMAIHPYPVHRSTTFSLPGGDTVSIRPIRPEDATLEREFVQGLSSEARYFRFMQALRELPVEQLVRLTQLDYAREMALIATIGQLGKESMIGVARYSLNPDGISAEFALVVADRWQGRGIGSRLMRLLLEAARDSGIAIIEGEVLRTNSRMLKFAAGLGFSVKNTLDDPTTAQISIEL